MGKRDDDDDDKFVLIPHWVIDSQMFKPAALLTYMALCRHADSTTGECFPSNDLLVKETGLAKQTIVGARRHLEGLGILVVVKQSKGRGSNVYKLTRLPRTHDVDLVKRSNGLYKDRLSRRDSERSPNRLNGYQQPSNSLPVNRLNDDHEEEPLEEPTKKNHSFVHSRQARTIKSEDLRNQYIEAFTAALGIAPDDKTIAQRVRRGEDKLQADIDAYWSVAADRAARHEAEAPEVPELVTVVSGNRTSEDHRFSQVALS